MSEEDTPSSGNLSFHVTVPQQMMTSCAGSVLTSLLMTPFDVVKIRLQAEQQRGRNVMSTLLKITRYEGLVTLWSGLSLTLASAVPCTVIYFTTYENLKLFIKHYHQGEEEPFWVPPVAGATARAWAVSLVSPLELIKTKMQSQKFHFFEIGHALQNLVQTHGFQGLFKGLSSTLFRDVPFSGIYWFNYELVKSSLPSDMPVFEASFFSGFIAGSVAATITTPFDVVKTTQQVEWEEKTAHKGTSSRRSNIPQIVQHIYNTVGIRGLFAGLTPRLVKVAPACAIMISTYEYGKHFFYKYNQAKRQSKTDDVPA